jgi:creatinine amidohydrolase
MRGIWIALALGLIAAPLPQTAPPRDRQKETARGVRLEDLSWTDAEPHLTADAVVVLPLGAGAKEHGPHLKLRNDLTLAEYLTTRVIAAAPVIVAPTLTYHFYPAFLEYHGSTSLGLATARDLTADVVRSLARSGPKRFYVLNTGISTLRPLEAAAQVLAGEGVLLRYTDLQAHTDGPARALQQQPGGTHADEVETSMMLYINPAAVDMTRAVRDYVPAAPGVFRLTRDPNGPGTYSRTGTWGDPTLATREKGRAIVEALVAGIVGDIEALRRAALPVGARTTTPAPPAAPGPRARGAGGAHGCSEGDERSIRAIAPRFALAWSNLDADGLASLWSFDGDIAHPDGTVERGAAVIKQNRAALFARPEYRGSQHYLTIGQVRCLTADVAVADGKWELRGVANASRQALPPIDGLCTLVLKRADGWAIEAYRYTINPRTGSAPSVLKRPGFVGEE